MKLSNKGRYAVRALFDIAFFSEGAPTQVRDIAEREQIPARFLEQIFQDLKRAGIVGAKRGPSGGYTLSRQAEEVSMGDIIRALEGPLTLQERPGKGRARALAIDTQRLTDEVFTELAAKVESCFDAVSVADLCKRAEAMGLRRPSAGRVRPAAVGR